MYWLWCCLARELKISQQWEAESLRLRLNNRKATQMLNWYGDKQGYCDGIGRRDFFRVGSLAFGGLSLPALLKAESSANDRATRKNIINIFLSGGPSHLDTFDLKPNAPKEFRGEFEPIATNVPGFEICQHMPLLAQSADKITAIRSIVGMNDEHTNIQSDTGWPNTSLMSIGGRPSIGSVMSKLWSPAQTTVAGTAPTFVDLTGSSNPGFLGQIFAPYRPDGEGRSNLKLNQSISSTRLTERRNLLSGFDKMRRDVDASGMMNALDSFSERAVGIVTSGAIAKALDISQADPRSVDRYGISNRRDLERFLVARRLIETGVRCVSFSWGGWDTHSQNFVTLRDQLPALDRALSALIQDLDAHGQLNDTIIMMSGEFGRTPRVNGTAGRDHWSRAAFVFLAGGGFRHGQAIGSTNRLGEVAQDRPVHLQHVFTTIYKQLGIDPDHAVLQDPNGRPQFLVDNRSLVSELI